MDLKQFIRDVPDWPKPGILFRDVTTLLKDGAAWREALDRLAAACRPFSAEVVVSPEARGFIVGAALAAQLGVGFVPVRKKGKLPWHTLRGEYALEYGTDVLEIHRDAVRPGQRVVVVDDLLATGGTIRATADMVEKLGGVVCGAVFLIELTYLPGREALKGYNVVSIIKL